MSAAQFLTRPITTFSSSSGASAAGRQEQTVDGQRAHLVRDDAAAAKGLHERDPVVLVVHRIELEVRRHDRAQVVAEGDVDRRAVVERADAHLEDVLRRVRRLVGEPVDQVGMQLPGGQDAGAVGRDPQQIGDAALVDRQEGVEDGGDEDRAAIVRLGQVRVVVRIGLARLPLAGLLVDLADRVAERAALAGRLAELLRELAQEVLAREVAARRGDLVAQHVGEGEVLEERDEVRERLVEGEHVGIARLVEAAVHAVEQRVRHLVRDDVVGEAGEDGERRRAGSFRAHRRGEVAEEQRLLRRAVVRVRLAQRVRIDAQPRHVLLA